MTSRDFCYWLQGFFELGSPSGCPISGDQVETIRKHLALVFAHEIDPSMGGPKEQAKLDKIHSGPGEKPVYRC